MALQTWVARFVVAHGRVAEEGGRLRSFHRRRIDEEDVELHVLAEPRGAKAEEFAEQAVEAIGRHFLQDRLSITGGLNRALAATHQTLADWNRRSLDPDKVAIGTTALALRGLTAHLVQLGPSLVFLRRDARIERLVPLEGAAAALGEADLVAPEARRLELRAGDVLLAASASIESVLDFETLEALLGRGMDEAMAELYLLTRNQESFALFALSCFEDDSDPAPAPAAEPRVEESPGEPRAASPRDSREPSRPRRAVEAEPAPRSPEYLVAPPPLDISRPVVRLRADQPAGREYGRSAATAPRRPPTVSKPLLLGGIAVVLIVIGAAITVPDLVQANREERTASIQGQAADAYDAALAQTDPDARRSLLEETRRLAREALRLDPENQAAIELQGQATAALNALDQIFDLGPMASVAVIGGLITGDIFIERLVIANDTAYLLDSSGGRVIALAFASPDAPAIVYQQDEIYGGTTARAPLFIAWDAGFEGGRLLILDGERKLFAVVPGGTAQPLPLRRSSTWLSFVDVATYDGNLYVLDGDGSQVHRYLPSADGFDSEPGPALAGSPVLTAAIGLAITSDIYVLVREGDAGRIVRFHNGIEAAFPLGGIDRPLLAPTSLTAIEAAGELLIADTGNKRIVVADQEGNFRRQLVSNAFIDLRAIGVDAAGSQLYAVVGDTLVTAPLVR